MTLQDRIKDKLLGINPVPLENLCDLPSSLGYDRVAGTIRALHAVAGELHEQVGGWVRCEDELPNPFLPNDPDGTRVVIGFDPNRDVSIIKQDILNATYFRANWRERGYTHWMYAPADPVA